MNFTTKEHAIQKKKKTKFSLHLTSPKFLLWTSKASRSLMSKGPLNMASHHGLLYLGILGLHIEQWAFNKTMWARVSACSIAHLSLAWSSMRLFTNIQITIKAFEYPANMRHCFIENTIKASEGTAKQVQPCENLTRPNEPIRLLGKAWAEQKYCSYLFGWC